MPADIYARGAQDFARVQRELKNMGDQGKGLKKELYAGINRAVKPMRAAVKAEAPGYVGNKHGFGAEFGQSLKVTVSKRGGANPAIRLVGKRGKSNVSRMDKGELRHPTFDRWKSQDGKSLAAVTQIRPGFWEKTLESMAPVVRREVLAAIAVVARKLN